MKTYVIQAGENGPVKIGHATFPDERLSALQTAHYEELRIIRVIDGDSEGDMHRRFAAFHIRREWFRFDEEMLTYVPSEVTDEGFDALMAEYRAALGMEAE